MALDLQMGQLTSTVAWSVRGDAVAAQWRTGAGRKDIRPRPGDARGAARRQLRIVRKFETRRSTHDAARAVSQRGSNREAGPAAARGGRLRVVDAERGADQVVDEIDLGTGQIAERHLVD